MKEKILEKLFSGKELTPEELVYVGKNLKEDDGFEVPTFDHESQSAIESCGLSEEFIERLNKEFAEIFNSDDVKSVSGLVERFEPYVVSSPMRTRAAVFSIVQTYISKAAAEKVMRELGIGDRDVMQNPDGSVTGKIELKPGEDIGEAIKKFLSGRKKGKGGPLDERKGI